MIGLSRLVGCGAACTAPVPAFDPGAFVRSARAAGRQTSGAPMRDRTLVEPGFLSPAKAHRSAGSRWPGSNVYRATPVINLAGTMVLAAQSSVRRKRVTAMVMATSISAVSQTASPARS